MNRFLTTEPFCQPQTFQPSILKGKVNEWLKYGFSIYENPCRKEFLKRRLKQSPDEWNLEAKLPGDSVSVFGQTHPLHIYFPFGNVNVECSRFYYVPTFCARMPWHIFAAVPRIRRSLNCARAAE